MFDFNFWKNKNDLLRLVIKMTNPEHRETGRGSSAPLEQVGQWAKAPGLPLATYSVFCTKTGKLPSMGSCQRS